MKRLLFFFVAVSCFGLMIVARGGRGGGRHHHGNHRWSGGFGWRGGRGFGWRVPAFGISLGLPLNRPYYNDCPSRRSCKEYPNRSICKQCYPDLYE